MDKTLERKLVDLRRRIRKLDGALVAFSGGVDSTFLMRICREELGEKAVAVTALSDHYPTSELTLARRVARIIGAKHVVVEPSGDGESRPVSQCRGGNVYSCLKSLAMRMKVKNVIDGSHRDDASERGRSFIAAKRAGVRSPLLESDLSKAEIRLLAKEFGLPNWDKPASSRAPKAKATASGLPSAKVREARKFVASLAPKAKMKASGTSALLVAAGKDMVNVAKSFGAIRKKLRSLGFSDVMLKMSA
ncbi:MAG: asparagine synthase-related protein [Candidatus Micrarchaeota archaeon]